MSFAQENSDAVTDQQRSQTIRDMFSAIAPRYDLLNRLLSAGRDRVWRIRAVDLLDPKPDETHLDVATGTADVALEIASRNEDIHVVGVDVSQAMLDLAERKIRSTLKDSGRIHLQKGCAEKLPYEDERFDGAISAFGVRNFTQLSQGLEEMNRVLKPNGRLIVLEFSFPKNPIFKLIYEIYFKVLLPLFGRWVSRHRTAYQYLPDSVMSFPQGQAFCDILREAGFSSIRQVPLTFGIVTLYQGTKNG